MSILNKKWSKLDLTFVIGAIASISLLYVGWIDEEYFLKNITISKGKSPISFYITSLAFLSFLVFCLFMLTKDNSRFNDPDYKE